MQPEQPARVRLAALERWSAFLERPRSQAYLPRGFIPFVCEPEVRREALEELAQRARSAAVRLSWPVVQPGVRGCPGPRLVRLPLESEIEFDGLVLFVSGHLDLDQHGHMTDVPELPFYGVEGETIAETARRLAWVDRRCVLEAARKEWRAKGRRKGRSHAS
jgi:hypothetical protein